MQPAANSVTLVAPSLPIRVDQAVMPCAVTAVPCAVTAMSCAVTAVAAGGHSRDRRLSVTVRRAGRGLHIAYSWSPTAGDHGRQRRSRLDRRDRRRSRRSRPPVTARRANAPAAGPFPAPRDCARRPCVATRAGAPQQPGLGLTPHGPGPTPRMPAAGLGGGPPRPAVHGCPPAGD